MTGSRTRVVIFVVQRLRHYTTMQLLPNTLIFYIYISTTIKNES